MLFFKKTHPFYYAGTMPKEPLHLLTFANAARFMLFFDIINLNKFILKSNN